jgi:hypothetical protein
MRCADHGWRSPRPLQASKRLLASSGKRTLPPPRSGRRADAAAPARGAASTAAQSLAGAARTKLGSLLAPPPVLPLMSASGRPHARTLCSSSETKSRRGGQACAGQMRSYRLSAPERAMSGSVVLRWASLLRPSAHAKQNRQLCWGGVGTLQLLPRTPSPRCPASFRLGLCWARNRATGALPGVRAAAERKSHAKPAADGLSAWHRSTSAVACVPANTAGGLPLQRS